ncbi:hypothetical protein OS493_032731 [Desmophyllum pertusum]|uniref:G-protein coupled receptors family 1 profile domain-containing protein n=1 Tax=Desmophyllum pertusum TaxID=174260 RepID=A0A9X0D891_9CNID|nr:hypothetical protein OS493_032731 [Desmophyllum pertusum]
MAKTLSSIIGGCGVILNSVVCLLYIASPQLLDAPNIFILNIAIGDFTYSLVALPLVIMSNVQGEWMFGEAGCTGYAFLTTFFGLGSMMNLAGAAYERFFTFCRLYSNGETQFSRKKAILLSVMLWCYSLFWSLMPVLAVIIYCYYKIHAALAKLTEQAVENWGENSRVTQDTVQAERKMAWITVAMTAGFLIAWTPYTLVSLVAIIKPSLVSDVGASIPAYIAKSSACYNPIMYVFIYKKLRDKLVDIVCCKKGQVHPGDVSSLATYRKSGTTQSRNQKTASVLSTPGPATV